MTYQKYKFEKYDSRYPKLFIKEKRKLIKILPKNIRIEHVGSTAVLGLGGKGIIDIAIKTPKNKLHQFISKLIKLGYDYNLEHSGNDKRIFLQKKIKYGGNERRVHIHLTLDNRFWDSFILFRNYLINYDKERAKYAQIKKEAVRYAKGEGKKYRAYKEKFIKNLMTKAINEKKNR
jgi:GrpB-like predicted nucleotidyltransferase (UPF0157 family)